MEEICMSDGKFTIITAFAEGYYSGQTYLENVVMTNEFYEKNKEVLDEISLYIGELDGKHSEVECYIEIDEMDGNTLQDLEENDGCRLYEKICDELGVETIPSGDFYERQKALREQSPIIHMTAELKEHQKYDFVVYCNNNGIKLTLN